MKKIIVVLIIISAIIGYIEYKDYQRKKEAQKFVSDIIEIIKTNKKKSLLLFKDNH